MGYFEQFNAGQGIPFMEGRDKANLADITGQPVHIIDHGFIKGEDGDFAVIALAEYPAVFFFGNAYITDVLKQVDEDGMQGALAEQSIVFSKKTSKRGREYMSFEFTGDIPF